MPSTGVMDAFKNLIRHGKHAQAHQQQQKDQDESYKTTQQQQRNAQELIDQDRRQHERSTGHKSTQPTKQSTAQQYTKEAEIIVQEETEAKTKMPLYKGLERFQLTDKMGDGAFSNVYSAIDKTTGQKVAVKVVRKYELNAQQAGDKHLNPQFKKRPRVTERANILKEVQIMRGIDHPGIVKLISFSESDEHYFLVLELLQGGELFHQIVKLTYFSEDLSRHVIVQVAKGIRYLHEERGVVHRDIKPENLLFERIPIIPSKSPIHRPYDEEKEDEGDYTIGVGGGGIGVVKIADFGLSKIVWEETTKTPCGTVGYTAPEIVKDERYSKSVDMWALGCVLYTLLCGFPPFYDESINVLTEKVARGYYTFLSPWWDEISHSAKDLITHLLCVDPTQRYTIDEFLAHPWCNEKPVSTSAVPASAIPQRVRNHAHSHLSGRVAARSPGIAALKEAFDVTYAVHRMEEEGGQRGGKGAGGRGPLSELNEDEEEEDEQYPAPVQSRSTAANDSSRYNGRAGARDQGSVRRRAAGGSPRTTGSRAPGFELDIGNATLLGRRHKNTAGRESSPLKLSTAVGNGNHRDDKPFSLGSPMRGIEEH